MDASSREYSPIAPTNYYTELDIIASTTPSGVLRLALLISTVDYHLKSRQRALSKRNLSHPHAVYNNQTTVCPTLNMDASNEKTAYDAKVDPTMLTDTSDPEVGSTRDVGSRQHELHRKLNSKQVQLFAIGGAIGTSLYVQMGSALPKGGPAGLFLGFFVWGCVMLCVNECFGKCPRR